MDRRTVLALGAVVPPLLVAAPVAACPPPSRHVPLRPSEREAMLRFLRRFRLLYNASRATEAAAMFGEAGGKVIGRQVSNKWAGQEALASALAAMRKGYGPIVTEAEDQVCAFKPYSFGVLFFFRTKTTPEFQMCGPNFAEMAIDLFFYRDSRPGGRMVLSGFYIGDIPWHLAEPPEPEPGE